MLEILVATNSKLLAFGILSALGGVAASLVLIIPSFSGNTLNAGSVDSNNLKRIIAFDTYYSQGEPGRNFHYVQVSPSNSTLSHGMAVNSKVWFLSPFGKTMQQFEEQNINTTATSEARERFIGDADAQEYYQLIRLPEWLGGSAGDLSAYRAYNALDISSHCIVAYWPDEGRMDLADPCHSNRYRAWDGLAYAGVSSLGSSGGSAMLFTSDYLALPQIRLAIDNEGYLAAYKPDNTLYGDGVVGEGRRFTQDNLEQSNLKLINTVVHGSKVKIPAEILPGYNLIWLSPTGIHSEFGHRVDSLGSVEQSTSFVATYRQKSSREFYDYSVTAFALPDNSDFALTGDKQTYAAKAEQIFNKTFGSLECYEAQTCTYETRFDDENYGRYAMISTQHVSDPTRDDRFKDAVYGRALVWLDDAQEGDNMRQYLIVLDATNEDMGSVIQAIKSLEVVR